MWRTRPWFECDGRLARLTKLGNFYFVEWLLEIAFFFACGLGIGYVYGRWHEREDWIRRGGKWWGQKR